MNHTLKNTIVGAALAVIAAHSAQAQSLLITELNSNASLGDFWELTNFGPTPVNLFNGTSPWSWDDESAAAGTIVLPLNITIAPGESIVFLADNNNVPQFRTAWNLPASVQVYGDPTGTGLGGGDAVTLFNELGQSMAFFDYDIGGFTRSSGAASTAGHAGLSAGGSSQTQSAIWDPNFGNTPATARYTFADGTNFGSYDAPGSTGFGSPGLIPEPSTAILLGLGSLLAAASRRRAASKA